MRMRRKRNLAPRLEACSEFLAASGRPMKNLKEAAESYRDLFDFRSMFGNDAPVELEVGCGNGGFIFALAKREPAVNFLAAEVCSNVILTAMEKVKRENVPNVRFMNIPAEILQCYVPEKSIRRIYLNFSTPLPGSSREKQRLTSPRFLAIYRSLLCAGGEIVQKTDSEPFFEYSLEQFAGNGFEVKDVTRDLHRSAYAADNIVTEYEKNFSEKGFPIFRAVAVLK